MAEAMAVPRTQDDGEIQSDFLMILPEIGRLIRSCFRYETADNREELVQEALCQAWAMFATAYEKGKRLSAHGLAWYSWLAVKSGRRFCWLSKRSVEQWTSLETINPDELLATDWKNRAPLADQVRFRLDWAAFVKECSADEAKAMALLAIGNKRIEAAAALGVSPAWMTVHLTRLHRKWMMEFEAEQEENWEPAQEPA